MKTNLYSDSQQFNQYLLVAYRTSSIKKKNKNKQRHTYKISTEVKKLPGSGLEQPHRFVGAYRFREIANPLIDN
jgi:hypothetical protein